MKCKIVFCVLGLLCFVCCSLLATAEEITTATNNVPATQIVKDVFVPLPAGQVQLRGYLGEIIKTSCKNWNCGDVPYKETVEFFRTGRKQFALGEMWGKLVRSGSLFYRCTGDAELKGILDATVADILTTQRENGSISCVPPEKQPETSDLWERKYVLIGLEDYYEYVEQKPEVLASLKRQVDCLISQIGKPPKTSILDVGWSHGKHGKNHIESSTLLEPVVRLYKMTGEKRYLEFAEYIISEGGCLEANLFDAAYNNVLPYKMCKIYPKAYDTLSLFEGLVEYYRCTDNKRHRQSALNLFENVRKNEITIIGNGGSDQPYHPTVLGEAFGNTAIEQTNPKITRMMETCTGVTWMKYCAHLLRLEGDQKYFDEIERYVYNGLIGAMKPDGRGFSYVNLLNGKKTNDHGWGWNFDSKHGGKLHVTCCNLNGPEGLAYIPYLAVMYEPNPQNPAFIINLYEDATVKTKTPKGQPLTLEILDGFPKSHEVKIKVTMEKPEEFSIKLRIPTWAFMVNVKLGEEVLKFPQKKLTEETKKILQSEDSANFEESLAQFPSPGKYAEVKRQWKSGDELTIMLSTYARLVKPPEGGTSPNSDKYRAVQFGPFILCRNAEVDPDYNKPVSISYNRKFWNVHAERTFNDDGTFMFNVKTSTGTIKMFPYAQVNGWNGAKIQTWLPMLSDD
ncbi:MAG: glycoside hydrolase family 127 protein [Planctomycetaceae bacterium]|jgi:DUF1680 family protein|nr:glycoside hydrolase family 127 protein [Planctomycetaceae bacterium]